ncbi:GATA protein [Hibiscus syriacus]|uniref:GATA protein n=1 Tax=Hibiscus syriacus TaxID=106335 RepID=A0A6A2XNA1_HIBSY|nr:auxin-responsive protein SAUR15-like [Hibiscus syriacus]KAE8668435.1 GATA protein [Hibiscus syriacus]
MRRLCHASGGDNDGGEQSQYECLLREFEQMSPSASTPSGFFAVYVGEDGERFVVPTSFLSHPLFKMLLDKSYNEYGFEQRDKLIAPCSVSTFQQVVNAVGCCNGKFHFGKLVQDLL